MSLDTSRIHAILFDIDGTLSDSDDHMVSRLEKIIRFPLFFLNPTRQHALARWLVMAMESPGNFIYNQADRFDLDSLFIRILNQRSRSRKEKKKEHWIIPGIKDMLHALSLHYPLGVVSARDEASSLAFIHQFGLKEFFSVIVSSQTCRYTKPFPDPLIYAADQLGVAPQNCLMVGDTTVDMRAAMLAGMQALGVLCGFGRQAELERAGAHLILPSTADLLHLPGILPEQPKKE